MEARIKEVEAVLHMKEQEKQELMAMANKTTPEKSEWCKNEIAMRNMMIEQLKEEIKMLKSG